MGESSGPGERRRSYDGAPRAGRSAGRAAEVWLRGNVRPVLGLGLFCSGILAVTLGAAAVAGAPPVMVRGLAAALAAVGAAAAALAAAAAGPRLGRRGDALLVRLSPWRTEAVPLAVVECVFPGSQPLTGPVLEHVHAAADAGTGAAPTRRVGTLVIRFAERAREWRDRPTFAGWGTWHDGHAIIDGRWCEPLSAAVAQRIGQRLLEAKREAPPEASR